MVIFNKLHKLNHLLLSSSIFSTSTLSSSPVSSIASLLAASNKYSKKALIEYHLLSNHFCEDYNMPALPQAAFAACKIRSYIEQEDTSTKIISKIRNNGDDNNKQESTKNFSNEKLMEYTPVKYNSKLMNSIWGFYNRYSPHNIKGNDDESPLLEQNTLQQSLTVASYAIAENIAITFQSFGDEWNFKCSKNCYK